MTVVTFDPRPRAQQSRSGLVPRKMFVVVEISPGAQMKVAQPADLMRLKEGRVVAREFMVLETEEEGIETASVLAAENPGRCFVCVELVAAAFEVWR